MSTTSEPPRRRLADAHVKLTDRIGEPAFQALCGLAGLLSVALIVWIAITVFNNASDAISHFGLAS